MRYFFLYAVFLFFSTNNYAATQQTSLSMILFVTTTANKDGLLISFTAKEAAFSTEVIPPFYKILLPYQSFPSRKHHISQEKLTGGFFQKRPNFYGFFAETKATLINAGLTAIHEHLKKPDAQTSDILTIPFKIFRFYTEGSSY